MGRWIIPPNLHSEIIGGPLCFFHEHSIGSKDGRVPRYSDSHACVRCVSSLTEGRLTLDVHKIHRKHRRRFLEFWSFVEIAEPDECWHWHGYTNEQARASYFPVPRHWHKTRQFSVMRVATWYTWGDIGRLPIKRLCSTRDCCNPLHVRIQGVPHYYHSRRLHLIDLEFSSHKLDQETLLFLRATQDKDPSRFALMEASSKMWLDFRMSSDGPVSRELMETVEDLDDDDDDDDDGSEFSLIT
jgi:hypothetical protein